MNQAESKNIFYKTSDDFLKTHKETLVLECAIFKNKENMKKLRFFRFYKTFMLVSKFENLQNFKVALYDTHFLVNFKYDSAINKPVSDEYFTSFEISNNDIKVVYTSLNRDDMAKVFAVLKKSVNLGCFHEYFRSAKKVGRGTFASVYLAHSIIDKKIYAVKATSKAFLNANGGEASLFSEVSILRQLNHENIIPLDSVYETANSYYLVFEMFMGGNLNQYVRLNGTFNETQAAFVIKAILLAVKHLHDRNIMHRDIKPDNILLRSKYIYENGQIVLADFGLATSNDVKQYLHPKCGTPGFAAPEIFAISCPEDHYALKCDMFSVGVTLYFMLTCHLPYQGKYEIHRENKEICLDFQKYKQYRNLSPQAKEFIIHLVCKKEERFDVYQALDHPFIRGGNADFITKNVQVQKYSNENLEDEEIDSTQRHINTLEHNIKEFNSRKINLVEKNLVNISHGCFLVHQRIANEKSISFLSLTPIFNGIVKTARSLNSIFSINRDEEIYNNLENEDGILDNDNFSSPGIKERIKK